MKMCSYQHRNSYHKEKTTSSMSYLYNGTPRLERLFFLFLYSDTCMYKVATDFSCLSNMWSFTTGRINIIL